MENDVMLSGCKDRVMVACVTFETVMITEPVKAHHTTRVHLIHWISELNESVGDPRSVERKGKMRIYQEFYDHVVEKLRSDVEGVEIVEHIARVFDFSEMLRTVLDILRMEQDSQVYINISAGSSEYTAAAVVASMMNPVVEAFSVITDRFTVDSPDEVRRVYYDPDTGKPVGLTKSVRDVKSIPKYRMDMPKEHLVRGLRMLSEKIATKGPTSAMYMVYSLKKAGLWLRDNGEPVPEKPVRDQTEAVYYHRDYVAPWLANGWVEKDDVFKNRLRVLPEGQRIMDTFYVGM